MIVKMFRNVWGLKYHGYWAKRPKTLKIQMPFAHDSKNVYKRLDLKCHEKWTKRNKNCKNF